MIDELANQVITYAFRPSPTKRNPSPPKVQGKEPILTPLGWQHSWEATRKKLFDLALAESKFGPEGADRQAPRGQRAGRPGLRRVDSMDFLDRAEQEAGSSSANVDGFGRAAR